MKLKAEQPNKIRLIPMGASLGIEPVFPKYYIKRTPPTCPISNYLMYDPELAKEITQNGREYLSRVSQEAR